MKLKNLIETVNAIHFERILLALGTDADILAQFNTSQLLISRHSAAHL